jgi:transcriptional regulator GlxA family with amidase domain
MDYLKNTVMTIPRQYRKLIGFIWEETNNAFHLPSEFPCIRVKEGAVFASEQFVKSYLEQLLLILIREKLANIPQQTIQLIEDNETEIFIQIINILKQNVYGAITTVELAAKLGFSRQYLGRIFKREYNATINQYYINLKIKEAKKLIRKEEYNFAQIAELLRFSDSAHFSRVFKRNAGMLPSEYKSSIIQ